MTSIGNKSCQFCKKKISIHSLSTIFCSSDCFSNYLKRRNEIFEACKSALELSKLGHSKEDIKNYITNELKISPEEFKAYVQEMHNEK